MTARALLAAAMVVALAACGDAKTPPPVAADPVADSADYVMYGVRNFLTDKGVQQAQLQSDTVFVFNEGTRFMLRKVHLTFYTQQGVQNAVLVGKRGRYDTRQQQMEAIGDVVVTSTDGRRLETPQLRFDQGRNEISSDSAYVATDAGGRRQQGIGFRSDPNMRNVQCLRSCSGALGPVSLPTETAPASAPPAATATAAPAPATRPGDRPGSFRLP